MMTPALDYALTMLDIYLNDDDWQSKAISHYLEIAMAERVRIDRGRELEILLERMNEIKE